jgi:hypothetical protein
MRQHDWEVTATLLPQQQGQQRLAVEAHLCRVIQLHFPPAGIRRPIPSVPAPVCNFVTAFIHSANKSIKLVPQLYTLQSPATNPRPTLEADEDSLWEREPLKSTQDSIPNALISYKSAIHVCSDPANEPANFLRDNEGVHSCFQARSCARTRVVRESRHP